MPWHQPVPVGAVAPGQFHTIPFGYNPSVSGWPGAVGDIVQNAGSTSAWVRNGTADTAWVVFPQAGGGGGTVKSAVLPLQITDAGAVQVVDGGIQSSSAVAITGGTMSGVTITNSSLDLLSLPSMAASTFLCNTTGGTTTPTACSTQQTDSLLVHEYYQKLGTAGNVLTVSGLNGDTDGEYLVDGLFFVSAGGTSLKFQIQTADTNLSGFSSNLLVGGVATTNCSIAQASQNPATFSSSDTIYFQGRINARSGYTRFMALQMWGTKGGSTTAWNFYCFWNDSSTVMTSMSLASSLSTGLAAGSRLRLLRVQSTLTMN